MTATGEERTPLELVDEWQRRAWGDHDLTAVDELLAEPFIRHNRDGTSRRSRDEVKADLAHYQAALGKPIIDVHDRVASGDRVWSRTTMRGANLHTGESHTVEWIQIHRVEAGRIAEVWTLQAVDVDWDS